MALPTVDCFLGIPPEERMRAIYEALLDVVENTGGATGSGNYTSTIDVATASGSIPAGVLGWSITAISGTVTVNGESVPNGLRVGGGGYGGRTSTAAITYTVAAGSAAVAYDTTA